MEKNNNAATGSLKISDDVIIRIAEIAAAEIDGVYSVDKRLISSWYKIPFADKLFSPVKIALSKETVVIDISVIIKNGYKAAEIAGKVQAAVKSSVQNMTKIAVSKVNVTVAGIELEKDA